MLAHLVTTSDPAVKTIYEAIDEDYFKCIKDIEDDTKTSHFAQQLKSNKSDISIREGLLMLDAKRIILPKNAIKPIMERLHASHADQDKTIKLAQQLYFWQNMSNNIKTIIDNCNECQTHRPSQVTNLRVTTPPLIAYGAPMAHVGLDLFDFAGKKHLICVDRWSGFLLYKRLNSTSTQSVINVLENWFNILGWPSNIR